MSRLDMPRNGLTEALQLHAISLEKKLEQTETPLNTSLGDTTSESDEDSISESLDQSTSSVQSIIPPVVYFELYTTHNFSPRLSLLHNDARQLFAMPPHFFNIYASNPLGSRILDGFFYKIPSEEGILEQINDMQATLASHHGLELGAKFQWKPLRVPLDYLRFLYLQDIIKHPIMSKTGLTLSLEFKNKLDPITKYMKWVSQFENPLDLLAFQCTVQKAFDTSNRFPLNNRGWLSHPGEVQVYEGSVFGSDLQVLWHGNQQIFFNHTCLTAGHSLYLTDADADANSITTKSYPGHLSQSTLHNAQRMEFEQEPSNSALSLTHKQITLSSSLDSIAEWDEEFGLIFLVYMYFQENIQFNIHPFWLIQFYQLFDQSEDSLTHPQNENLQNAVKGELLSLDLFTEDNELVAPTRKQVRRAIKSSCRNNDKFKEMVLRAHKNNDRLLPDIVSLFKKCNRSHSEPSLGKQAKPPIAKRSTSEPQLSERSGKSKFCTIL